MQLFFQWVEIFFQSNLHPYESSTGHNTGCKYDEQKQGVAHIAALRVASPVKSRNMVMLDIATAQLRSLLMKEVFSEDCILCHGNYGDYW